MMAEPIHSTVHSIDFNAITREVEKKTKHEERMLAGALAAAAEGIPVLPAARPGHKFARGTIATGKEITPGVTYSHATTNPDTIKKWWGRGGNYYGRSVCWVTGDASSLTNAPGAVSLFVVDTDTETTEDGELIFRGEEELHKLEEDYGLLPEHAMQQSPSGGTHHLFAWSERLQNTVSAIAQCIDTRGGKYDSVKRRWATSGHVVAYPSPDYNLKRGGPVPRLPVWFCQMVFIATGSGKGININAEDTGFILPDTINKGERDDIMYRYGLSVLSKTGSHDTVKEQMHNVNEERCKPPLDVVQLEKIIDSIFKSNVAKDITQRQELEEELQTTQNGVIKNSEFNLGQLMDCPKFKDQFDIYYDEFFNAVCVNGELLRDVDYIAMKLFLSTVWNVEYGKDRIRDMTSYIANKNTRHAFKGWLEGLPAWNGYDHHTELLLGLTDENPDGLYGKFIQKMLVAAVARAYKPGTMVRTMLVLVGNQGIMKSTFWRKLCPNDWFTDGCTFDGLNNEHGIRELIKQSNGVVFAEVPEMRGVKQHTVEAVKHFLSATSAQLVDKWDKNASRMQRVGVFVGTSNPSEFLRDDTGSSRFWPLVCRNKRLDLSYVEQHLEQIWAQALAAYKDGGKHWLDPEDEEHLVEHNRKHETVFGPSEWIVEMVEEGELNDMFIIPADVRVLAKEHGVKMPSVREMERAFHKLGWASNKGISGKPWKFRATAIEDGKMFFGKRIQQGNTMALKVGWVASAVALEHGEAEAARAVWKACGEASNAVV